MCDLSHLLKFVCSHSFLLPFNWVWATQQQTHLVFSDIVKTYISRNSYRKYRGKNCCTIKLVYRDYSNPSSSEAIGNQEMVVIVMMVKIKLEVTTKITTTHHSLT